MAYFAKLNNNIVTEVIVADQDFINSGAVGDALLWIETSDSGAIRKNYAGIGYTYDSIKEAFIAPKPYPSWTLVEDTCIWTAPTTYPDDGESYKWDEDTTSWVAP